MPNLYNSSKWRRLRDEYKRKHPLCVRCGKPGYILDHVTPHRGDLVLFWNQGNWQTLCKLCHDSYKQRLEKSGRVAGCDKNGIPNDINHWWCRAVKK
jgi:5-methylcytosine-specific restriction endonuclease McrA